MIDRDYIGGKFKNMVSALFKRLISEYITVIIHSDVEMLRFMLFLAR